MSGSDNHYGVGGRLKEAAGKELVETAYAHDCEDGRVLLPYLVEANIAHLLVLQKKGLVSTSNTKEIIEGLKVLGTYKLQDFILDPANGDIYNNFDVSLKKVIGDKAGILHAGRPRREAVNVAFLLALRESLLEYIESASVLLDHFIKTAEKHIDTILPDYTYLLHAQPTNLAHYLMTFSTPLIRDIERIKELYTRVDSSPGESGSVNGSRLDLDKVLFAELLGFEHISIHSRDAMWQPDIPFEVITKVSSLMMNLSRLVEELLIWNTSEFGFLTLPDSLCRASVIMPQKKNPYPLTYFRGLTNSILSKCMSYGSYGKVASGHPDSRIFIYGDLLDSITKSSKALKLMGRLLSEIDFNKERMYQVVLASDCMATDLADAIISHTNIDYKKAHQLVGYMVRQLKSENKFLSDMTMSHYIKACQEIVGEVLEIDKVILEDLKNPAAIVDSRISLGGAAKPEVLKMLDNQRTKLSKTHNWLEKCILTLSSANNRRDDLIKEIKNERIT